MTYDFQNNLFYDLDFYTNIDMGGNFFFGGAGIISYFIINLIFTIFNIAHTSRRNDNKFHPRLYNYGLQFIFAKL